MSYTVYLAGPMSNIPQFNFPHFFAATEYLRDVHGWDVKSPAEKDLEQIPWGEMQKVPGFDTGDIAAYSANSTFSISNAMEWDLPAIQASDGIVMLEGWECSTGARWERVVAEALGRKVWLLYRGPNEWNLIEDPAQDQLTTYLRAFGAPVLDGISDTQLVRELQGRFRHHPVIAADLEKTFSRLAAF